MLTNTTKQALAEGKTVYGCAFNTLRSPEVARILAAAGFDYTYLDAEHGVFGIENIHDICRAAADTGITPLVRVADLQYSLIARALDNGAQGIIFPRVESPDLLAEAISWMKFPPVGIRGFGLTPTYSRYEAVKLGEQAAHVNANTLVVLQIETMKAVDCRDELLSVPGVDVVMVGPVDLSFSLEIPADFFHPKFIETVEKIQESCVAHGVVPGIQTRPVELARFWRDRGMRFIGCGLEAAMLLQGAKAVLSGLKG
jgi:2-dehydro-3-deoxyglucarate aldolase/4-hydroxy-2-oxoheptanedioate aldolase